MEGSRPSEPNTIINPILWPGIIKEAYNTDCPVLLPNGGTIIAATLPANADESDIPIELESEFDLLGCEPLLQVDSPDPEYFLLFIFCGD